MRVTVIGGGISGLVTAHRLAPYHEVTVLEAADRLGGCLRATTVDGAFPEGLDIGAEASLHRRSETRELAAELGLDAVFPSPAHSSQVFARGRLHPIPKRTVMGVPADPADVAELLGAEAAERVAAEVLSPPVTGDVSLGDFLSERLGAELVDTLVDPLLGGVYAGRCRNLSLAATVPALLPAARSGTSVLELVRELIAARESAAATPAPVFMSLVGGINRLVPALAERIRARGATLRLGTAVDALAASADGWTVSAAGAEIATDAVVVATPADVARQLLAEAAPAAASLLGGIPYASTALVLALVEVGESPLAGSGFLVPPTEDTFIKAATHVSNKWPWVRERLPAGTAVVRMSIGRFGDEPRTWQDLPETELARRAFADWQRITGRSDRLVAAEVRHWDEALPQYLPGHAKTVTAIDAALARVPGLELAGSAYHGVGIPACIERADVVATRLLTENGQNHVSVDTDGTPLRTDTDENTKKEHE